MSTYAPYSRAFVLAMMARLPRCSGVRSLEFSTSAHRVRFSSAVVAASPPVRSWFQVCRRTWSNALVAQATMWKGSRHSAASGARSVTTEWIHWGPHPR